VKEISAGGGITGGSEAEWPENVRAHTYTQTQTHNHGLVWRIHCGVEVTVSSTNKQHALASKDPYLVLLRPNSTPHWEPDPVSAVWRGQTTGGQNGPQAGTR